MVRPSKRGGVPVFKRPSVKPNFSSVFERPKRRRFADAAGWNLFFADMDEAAQKSAGGKNHSAAGNLAAIGEFHAANTAVLDHQVIGFGFDDVEIRNGRNRGLHGRRIELAIGLGARARARQGLCGGSKRGIGCRLYRPHGPSGRPERRFPAPDGLFPGRRWPDCRTWRQSSRIDGSQERFSRPYALKRPRLHSRHGRRQSPPHRISRACARYSGGRGRGQKQPVFGEMFHVKHSKSVSNTSEAPVFWRILGMSADEAGCTATI